MVSLLYIGQQLTMYVGFFFFFMGMMGNAVTIFIFASVRTYRTNPCTFYMLVGSIHNTIQLIPNLILRIINVGYGIDISRSSLIWCKSRLAFAGTFGIISLSCACLATIDQFLVTSRNVHLRQWSKIEWAHRIVIAVMLISWIQSIPWFVFFDISPTSQVCTYTNAAFGPYISIFIFVFLCAVPIVILFIFGCMTYRNIQQTMALAEHNADRQLTKMICIQVILIVVSQTPYGIYNTYMLFTTGIIKNANRLNIEYFTYTITSLMCYSYYAGMFYVFLVSSSRFRRTVKDRIFCWRRPNHIAHLIGP